MTNKITFVINVIIKFFILLLIPTFINTLIYAKKINPHQKKTKYIGFFCVNIILNGILFINSSNNNIFKTTYLHFFYYLITLLICDYLITITVIKIKKIISSKDKNYQFTILTIFKYFMSILLFFLCIDLIIRAECYKLNGFFQISRIFPNLLTFSYITLIFLIQMQLPNIGRKILNFIIDGCIIIFFLIQFFMINVKKQAFTFYDLVNSKEAMKYLNTLNQFINIKFILIIAIIIGIIIFKNICLKNIKDIRISKKSTIFLIALLITTRLYSSFILSTYNEKDWSASTYAKYFYDHFNDSTKTLEIAGIYEYTIKDLYHNLNKTKKGSIKEIKKILNNQNYLSEKNDYSGVFKDKNLIMILMEGVDNLVIDNKTMPTLSNLRSNGWNFPKRYSAKKDGGSTILTEFTSLTGTLYNKTLTNYIYLNEYSASIPKAFEKEGYQTTYFHINNGKYYNRTTLMHNIGFNESVFAFDLLEAQRFHYEFYDIQDPFLIENDDIYEKIVNKEQKFMSFIMTISAHGPYDECPNEKSQWNCLKEKSKKTDTMLELLINRLKEDNLYEDTVIILFSDHYAYLYEYSEKDYAKLDNIDGNYAIKAIPFIIFNNSIDSQVFDNILVNDVDILPTVMNLFDIEYDPNNYVGSDVFASYHNNIVFFNDYTWYDGKYYSENYSSKNDDYFDKVSKFVKERIDLSDMILSNNYYAFK